MEIIGYNNIYLLCEYRTLERKYVLFHGLAWKRFAVFITMQTSLLIRLKNMISRKQNFRFFRCNYTTSKTELKMMWLRRNTKVLDSFYPSKWEINACSMWWGYSMFKFIDFQSYWHDKHEWRPSYTTQKNYGSHTIACIHNTAHVNCCTCTYFFRKRLLQLSQHPSTSFFLNF